MQILKTYLFVGVVLFLSTSCTDYLTEVTPQQSLPSDAALSDAAGLQTALIGAYDALQSADLGAAGYAMNANILSDNAEWRGSFPSYVDMYNREMEATNAEPAGLWRTSYLAINHANLVINGVATIEDPDLTTELSNQLRGEALFLRGMIHFELVRLFALPYGNGSSSDLGVPVITEPTATGADITFPTRNTVQEVYDQAISDLTEAASLLPDMGDRGRANGTAATAYLAEIAFQQRDYSRAADLAAEVLDAGYVLAASPEEPFINEGSPEEIFAVISTVQDNPGVNGSLATFHHINGRGGDIVVNSDLLENGYLAIIKDEDQGAAAADGDSLVDLRFSLLTSEAVAGVINVEKYEDFTNNADDNILVRLPTYMLMRAEALARTDGVNDESIDLLNQVRNRSIRSQDADGAQSDASDAIDLEEDDFDDTDDLIEAIILERRVELAFENNRLHDLRRLMRDIRGLAFDNTTLLFPIPQRETDANSNLTQNPGY